MQFPLTRVRRPWRFSLRASAHGGFRFRFKASNAPTSILGKFMAKFSFLTRLHHSHINLRFNLSLPSNPSSHAVKSRGPATFLRRLFCRSRSSDSIDSLLREVFAVMSEKAAGGGMTRFVGGFVFIFGVVTALMFRNTWTILGVANNWVVNCLQKSWK
ncbi:hypothetical protein ZOSMA_84G00250 [Zostera marina]|uniref:Uncharacterized protein n=1 Tax=Zostera marina TaxID=29655 RepID=A0A0K9NND2_ZOSMR|nr:hypothetical protein ZOSMA_84G00250 [Zostera marina]